MGQWLRRYGDTIYGTRGGPWLPTKRAAATCKGNVVYVHIFNWDGDKATLPGIDRRIVSHAVLTGGNAQVTQTEEAVSISVPAADRQEIDTIVALTLDGPAFTAKPTKLPSVSVAKGKKATASNVFRKDVAHYGPAKAFDDDEHTRWATDGGTHSAWLEVDLGAPVTIYRARICEAYAGRVQEFELQVKDGEQWTTLAKGKRIGDELELSFKPVTAQIIRLNILKASEGPTIGEFELFEARK
jgi:alpha-L-fucosidase